VTAVTDTPTGSADRLDPGGRRTLSDRVRAVPRFLASIPVTLLTLGLLLLAGILTGTLFAPADPDDVAITSLEFGLPAFLEGRWWTLFTGAVTFVEPEFYLFVGLLLAVGLGLYERRVGSLRAAVALLVTHCVGVVVPALLLWPFAGSDWAWASMLAGDLDAGMSAGGFGVAAAATALLSPPWRGRLRVVGATYLTVMVLKSGLLWDLEHAVAFGTGLLIGPPLARGARRNRGLRPAQPTAGTPAVPTPVEARMMTALIAAAFAICNVVEALYPGVGGIVGPGVGPPEVRGFALIGLELVISLLIAGALPQPRGLPWWVATAAVSAIAVNSLLNTPRLPRTGDIVCALIVLAVLIWNRRAWPWRSDPSTLRPAGVLTTIMVVFAAVGSVAIWAVRDQFAPVPDGWRILWEAIARFTLTTGPVVPQTDTARAVLGLTGAIWALTLTGWLVWALYLRAPGGWRGARDAASGHVVEPAGGNSSSR
jgi:phosphatidylglycerol lysyltransferase